MLQNFHDSFPDFIVEIIKNQVRIGQTDIILLIADIMSYDRVTESKINCGSDR